MFSSSTRRLKKSESQNISQLTLHYYVFLTTAKSLYAVQVPHTVFFHQALKPQESFLPTTEVVQLIFVSGMSQGDWGKGGNPHMRIIAEDRDVIYSRQKSLKQTKHAEAGFNIRILQNSKIIQVVKNHKRSSCPTHHSKQGKPKGFCPEGLLYLQGTFQLNYFVLRPPLVRLTAQCYSNSFNLFNKEPGVHCQLRD